MTAQTITTPAGERLVVLPEAEYLALVEAVEDTVDRAVVERFRLRLAAGEEELVPEAIVARLLDGENPVRVWREHRGLSIPALAGRAGLAATDLAGIEAGADTDIATRQALGTALGLAPDDLSD